MAVRVRQQSYIQQPYIQQPVAPEQRQPIVKKKFKSGISPKEKFMYIAFVVLLAFLAVTVLQKQSSIQQTSMEIQEIESEIAEVEKQNVDLKVQVSELSTYERIWEKAKALGLTLNEKNVKVVPGE